MGTNSTALYTGSGDILISGVVGDLFGNKNAVYTGNGNVTISGVVDRIQSNSTSGTGIYAGGARSAVAISGRSGRVSPSNSWIVAACPIHASSYAVLDYTGHLTLSGSSPAVVRTVHFYYIESSPGGDELHEAYLSGPRPRIPTPTAPDYVSVSWYTDDDLTQQWDFRRTQVTEDMDLYAQAKSVSIAKIEGLTPPVAGAAPVKTIAETPQYTGTVTWDGNPTTFGYNTVYTATITLTPKTNYTFNGVSADFFTVGGTSSHATNAANSGVVTAVFVATGAMPINIPAIGGVTKPVAGAAPVTTIAETAQYTGTVTWNGSPATFGYDTVYTATITLVPKVGFTLSGVTANFFTVDGTSSHATNQANSGVITAVFPATAAAVLKTGDINGDDAVNMTDVLFIYQHFRGKIVLTAKQLAAADVNSNDAVNMQDVLLTYQYFRGKITEFPFQ